MSREIKLDEPAPVELQATSDANWNTLYRDVYAYMPTRCKGAVAHGLKRTPCWYFPSLAPTILPTGALRSPPKIGDGVTGEARAENR